MRISTNMMFERGIAGVNRPQAESLELQQKISSGRRVLNPSDDPIAAAAVISLNQAQSVNSQYGTNAANAQLTLTLESQALGDATRVLQDVKTLVVRAGAPGLQDADRLNIAAEVEGLYGELLGIANRSDSNGQYLFSGFQAAKQPFSETAPGVVDYAGDQGQRLVQVGAQRRVAVGDSGAEVFQRIREANGTFVAAPAGTNSGSGVAGPGVVRNAQAWASSNNRDYTVRFDVDNRAAPPVTTYDIVDNATNLSVVSGAPNGPGPYARTLQPGVAIDFQRLGGDPLTTPFDAGIRLDMTGAPASGDTFTVGAAATKDVFSMVHDFITALKSGAGSTEASHAVHQNRLNAVGQNVDRALDQILTVRASTGGRLAELDTVQRTTEDLGLHYAEVISRLQDLDYAKALSDLARQQFSMEAAQKSFVAVTRLKLFDFI